MTGVVLNVIALGLGVGLASVAGVRAFLPVALFLAFYYLTGADIPTTLSGFPIWIEIGVLLVPAVLESALDKVKSIERALNVVLTPVRALAGALLFGTASGAGVGAEAIPWLVAGGLVAGAVSVLKIFLRPPARAGSSGVSHPFLSAFEDAVALVGGAVGLLVPFLPAAFVAFLLFFFYRLRRRRGRKYGGLRILGD